MGSRTMARPGRSSASAWTTRQEPPPFTRRWVGPARTFGTNVGADCQSQLGDFEWEIQSFGNYLWCKPGEDGVTGTMDESRTRVDIDCTGSDTGARTNSRYATLDRAITLNGAIELTVRRGLRSSPGRSKSRSAMLLRRPSTTFLARTASTGEQSARLPSLLAQRYSAAAHAISRAAAPPAPPTFDPAEPGPRSRPSVRASSEPDPSSMTSEVSPVSGSIRPRSDALPVTDGNGFSGDDPPQLRGWAVPRGTVAPRFHPSSRCSRSAR